jgi:hypothetical protein
MAQMAKTSPESRPCKWSYSSWAPQQVAWNEAPASELWWPSYLEVRARQPKTSQNNYRVMGQPRSDGSGGGRGRRRRHDRAAIERGSNLGKFWPMCRWCMGLGGGRGGRTRTPRSVQADANRTQIFVKMHQAVGLDFSSVRIFLDQFRWPMCVGLLKML